MSPASALVCLTHCFWNPPKPSVPHYPVLISKRKPCRETFLRRRKAPEFLMIMCVNLMTVSSQSQLYKIGNEFFVVLDKWKMDLASPSCIYIHSHDMLKEWLCPLMDGLRELNTEVVNSLLWSPPLTPSPHSVRSSSDTMLRGWWAGFAFCQRAEVKPSGHIMTKLCWPQRGFHGALSALVKASRLSKCLLTSLALLTPQALLTVLLSEGLSSVLAPPLSGEG